MASSSAGTPVASLSHVTLEYEGGVRALDDVSLDIARGERVCVVGANGSGKSTLASVICGLLAPDEGDVTLVGQRVLAGGRVDFAAYAKARRSLGLVFQNPDDQIVTSVVEEDVAFGPENLQVAPDEIGRRVTRELHRVALEGYAKADPTRLSGGQRQRVAIAGALAMEPEVLVLDEPGALLDVRGRRSIMRVMGRLSQAGTTIVHVTHFMDEALEADRVIVMEHGHVALEGTPREVFSRGELLTSLKLSEPFCSRLAMRLSQLGLGVSWTCDSSELLDQVASLLGTGSDGGETSAAKAAGDADGMGRGDGGSAPLAIEASHVRYSYRSTDAREDSSPALDDVSLGVPEGTSCAIVGQTGSGKSTLLRLLCALEAPDSGSVVVHGIDTSRRRDRRRLHGRVGYVMQRPERQLFAETVLEDVAYGPSNLGLSRQEAEARAREALALVGLDDREGLSPFELSGGQQRMCAIAGVLAMRPRTIVLDEPTAGLDPLGREELHAILRRVHGGGVTVVEVTHSMDDAALCERVVVLDRSHVVGQGTPRQVFAAGNEAALESAGLGIPRALAWARELARRGVTGLGEPLSLEALAQAIARHADEASNGGRSI
ncbi:ABC transporter ATP-binding protein [Olsenella porci]|uniref:ATP-binding cassette domain-containing protein n=1 Tax=Olsenella porci TaxID=2652279 RepID=A0A6N7XLM7_9ACTN|nr:energy-coupling factor transporter ATPase [Olsenella porci]MST71874.1 ATP-binding cassette domain-containing protein [Olsenella porci]